MKKFQTPFPIDIRWVTEDQIQDFLEDEDLDAMYDDAESED